MTFLGGVLPSPDKAFPSSCLVPQKLAAVAVRRKYEPIKLSDSNYRLSA
jgi:hypothetical protein